jgi:ribosomal protein S18 acetylase RimI-like enzyme
MQATIRPATPEDLEGVLMLWQVAEAKPTHTDDLASLRQLLAIDPGALLVAYEGDDLVGSIIAGWDGWRGSIYRLAVSPDRRRRGVAAELLRAAVGRLEAEGAVRLQAIVLEDDVQAMGFWRATYWEQQVGRVRFVHG